MARCEMANRGGWGGEERKGGDVWGRVRMLGDTLAHIIQSLHRPCLDLPLRYNHSGLPNLSI